MLPHLERSESQADSLQSATAEYGLQKEAINLVNLVIISVQETHGPFSGPPLTLIRITKVSKDLAVFNGLML
jgi:hypothetical protein